METVQHNALQQHGTQLIFNAKTVHETCKENLQLSYKIGDANENKLSKQANSSNVQCRITIHIVACKINTSATLSAYDICMMYVSVSTSAWYRFLIICTLQVKNAMREGMCCIKNYKMPPSMHNTQTIN